MAGLAAKKRRIEVIDLLSSDDALSSPPPHSAIPLQSAKRTSSRRVVSSTSSRSTSTTAALRRVDSSANVNPKPAKTKKRSTGVAAESKPAPKKPAPKKPGAKKKGALYALFGTCDGLDLEPPESAISSQRIPTPSSTGGEDIIEDAISDDDDFTSTLLPPKKKTKAKQTSLVTHLTVSKPSDRILGKSGGLLFASKAPPKFSSSQSQPQPQPQSQQFTPTAVVKKKTELKAPTDLRPWAEKYAPKDITEVAVNKTKIAEVRKWLELVLQGQSSQRMLVLKGTAGVGKTTTIQALAKDMNLEIIEWRNPSNATPGEEYGEEGAFAAGLAGLFEEFVGRAGTFGSLDLVSSGMPTNANLTQLATPSNTLDSGNKKVILIEDFPSTLFSSSIGPLQSFRRAIKSFLALPPSPPGMPPLPPLVMIITETASVTGPDSFTARRLLSPEILTHPRTHEIGFNTIAATFMIKALYSIVEKESKVSGRKLGPSKTVLDAISSSGDIRSAIMGLEFLSMGGEVSCFKDPILPEKKRIRQKRGEDRELTPDELRVVQMVSQRESSWGIFHSVGKVVYNKRYGDDIEDPYMPPPPRPTRLDLPYHERPTRLDPNTFSDETGTDPRTFISAIHENYLGSCNLLGGLGRNYGTDEDVLESVIGCLSAFSDADLLCPTSFHSYSDTDTSAATIRADEIAFQTAIRGTLLALPSPVKRDFKRRHSTKMFYPTSSRLWRGRQETDDVVSWFAERRGETIGSCAGGTKEAVVDTMPYMALIERRGEWRRKRYKGAKDFFAERGQKDMPVDRAMKSALEKVSKFKGVGGPSEEAEEVGGTDESGTVKFSKKREKAVRWADGGGDENGRGIEEPVALESLVLEDDDIEEF